MKENFATGDYNHGTCGVCEKNDRDTIFVRCKQGTMEGQVCMKCLVALHKMRTPPKVVMAEVLVNRQVPNG